MSNRKGFTLMEMIITVALAAALSVGIAEMLGIGTGFFRSANVKQQLQNDGDLTVNTILNALRLAQKTSVVICSCGATFCSDACAADTPVAPNSRIEFKTGGSNTVTAIYQSSNTVVMQVGTRSQTLAAQNVVGLTFTGDGQDLSRIYISLTLAAASSLTQVDTVVIPSQAVRLTQ